jgi:[ribosomal protein S5]-alanine N-acetyltransferase
MNSSILKTKRLELVEFTVDDSDFILRLLNTPGWLENIGSRGVNSVSDAEKYIINKLIPSYHNNGFGFWLMRLKSTGEPVGMCGFAKRPGLDDPDVGFALLPEYEGQGYAFEAAKACMEYASTKMKIVVIKAITAKTNVRSQKLLEKIGLKFEKLITLPNDKEEIMLYSS